MAKYLEHRIFEKPEYISSHQVKPFKGAIYSELNDEMIIIDESYGARPNIVIGIGLIAGGVWILEGFKTFDIYAVFIALIPLIGLLMVIHGLFINKSQQIILDRLNGTISYSRSVFRKPINGRFKNLDAVIGAYGATDGYAHREYLKVINTWQPSILGNVKILSYNHPPIKAWSFFVWYMDKNRPLPPGTAFDPYREKDLKRRNAEGNPPPLYPSNIETPYDTP